MEPVIVGPAALAFFHVRERIGTVSCRQQRQPDQLSGRSIGQFATLHPDEHVTNYLLSTPQGEQIRGTLAGQEDAVSISGTDTPGHYRVRAGGSEGGFDRGFSTNLSSLATGLDRIDPVELKKIFGKHEFRLAPTARMISSVISAGRVGRELYPWLIVFVAIAVGLEQVVANRFYRNRE